MKPLDFRSASYDEIQFAHGGSFGPLTAANDVDSTDDLGEELRRIRERGDPRTSLHFTDEEYERHMALWQTINPHPEKIVHNQHGIHLETHDGVKVTVTKAHVTIGNKSDADTIRALVLHAKANWDGQLSPLGGGHDPQQLLAIWTHCQVHGVNFDYTPSPEDAAAMQPMIAQLRAKEAARAEETPAPEPAAQAQPAPQTETQPAPQEAVPGKFELSEEGQKVVDRVSLGSEYPKSEFKKDNDEQLGHAIAQLNPEEERLSNDWAHHVNGEQLGHTVAQLNPEEKALGDAWSNHVSAQPLPAEAKVAPEVTAKAEPQPETKAESQKEWKSGPYVIKTKLKGPGGF